MTTAPHDRPLDDLVIDPILDLGKPTFPSLMRLFAEHTDQHPERIAVTWNGRDYDYRTMWDWVGGIAASVSPGERVAVCGHRTPGTMAALWGVLAAGGVALPLDESLPPGRRRVMLEQSAATKVLAIGEVDLEWIGDPVEVVRISDSRPSGDSRPIPLLADDAEDAPACIFFTSGTSGIPKGVLGTTGSIAQFIHWMTTVFEIDERDRVAQMRSISFDASLREIFLPWTVGATICIAPDRLDPDQALAWIASERISILNVTPSHADVWLAALEGPVSTYLRWTMFSGEVLNEGLVRRWRSNVEPAGRIVNLYGPTETTMIRTYWVVPPDPPAGIQPVGFPIPHTQVLLVNADGNLSGPNETGEVFLRTTFGTRGYINDVASQLASFVPNPISNDKGDLVYRTGDLGWRNDEGALVVSGRIDDQVQILGVRVEPGEVAAHLSAHPQVSTAAVIAEHRSGQPSALIAYVVPVGNPPTVTDLRKHLTQSLAGPAIPARFELLVDMPLTVNGKVDRARLETAPRIGARLGEVSRLGALSPAKRRLLEMRLAGMEPNRSASLIPAPSVELDGNEIPLSYAQERLWFLDRLHPGTSSYNIPRAYRLRGPLDPSALRAGFDSIQARHEVLRTRYLERDGTPFQQIDPSDRAPFIIRDLTALDPDEREEAVSQLVRDESNWVFNLAIGPIWRVTLVVLTPTDHVLIVVVHHIAADGWSLPIVLSELRSVYVGAGADLPKLPKQYADYAREQRQRLETGGYEADLAYWQGQLEGAPPALPLPLDRPYPSPRDSRGSRHWFTIPAAPAELLDSLVRSHRVTPFMVGVALFSGFLSRVSGSGDPVVGVPSADRASTDLEGLIGFFVNSLPIRPGVPDETTFRQLLERVRETAIGAYNHRQVPFEHIVNRLQPPRSPDRTPIFHLFFQFGGAFDGRLELPGLEIEPVARQRSATKFDLTMYLGLTQGVLGGSVVYATDIFDAATIERLCDGFGAFAAAALADPDQAVSSLPIGEAPTIETAVDGSDRPAPVTASRMPTTQPQEASTATIARMCELWHRLLGVAVLPDDDFFALGGHSLMAVRIFSRIENEWRVELPIGALFDAPTPRLLSAHVDAVQRNAAQLTKQGLQRAPLSFGQRRLWFLDRLSPGSSAYHIPWRVGLEGHLDLGALQAAFDSLQQRHAVFRTRIVEEDGVPWQIVDPPGPVFIDQHDLTDLAAAEKSDQLRGLLAEHKLRSFDLSRDGMLRVMLIRTAPELHVLSTVVHHIASDADSMRILKRELKSVYEARRRGERADLPELAFEYTDVAAWQAERFANAGEPGLEHWQDRLGGKLPTLDLVTDRARPAQFTHRGAAFTLLVPDPVASSLLDLARAQAATPVMVLLSAFAVLLHRHTRQNDIIIGIPGTERVLPGTEGIIGFLVNSLPIRISLSPQDEFNEILGQVRRLVVEALDHGQVPFEAIVERVDPLRDPGRTPIYQAMFDLAQPVTDHFGLDGLKVVPTGVGGVERMAKFDLRLHCALRGNQLKVTFEYRTDLFEPPTINNLAAQFVRLLESIADNPAMGCELLDMTPPSDVVGQAAEDAAARRIVPTDATVTDVFEAVVRAHPDAIAIETATQRYSYSEVGESVHKLAGRLSEIGVRPGDAVGITIPRSAGTAVAMLAVLQAQAAYVPLDPGYPEARLRSISSEARITVIVGGDGTPEGLTVDRVGQWSPPPEELAGGGIAYVMYTSGSTGQPKGVVIPHMAIIRLVANANYVTLGVGDGVAFASNVAFDAATFEVFGALLNGARLVVMEPDALMSPPELARQLRERSVSTMFLTTALFNAVIAEQPDAFATLRDLLFGGEKVDQSAVRRCLMAGPPRRLVHVYGPTESTTFTTFHLVASVHENARSVPIGLPVTNTILRVVDRNLAPVPSGVPGELLIGGDGLASGYLNDPDLTRARFVSIDGRRFYRSGDLVRRGPDGAIDFLGRLDRQIKLNGFRIEPGEIEARLKELPAVGEAVVVARPYQGRTRLAAYVVVRGSEPMETDGLLDHLRTSLPDFMIPDTIDPIDRMPLNTNGKVDEAALPDPDRRSSTRSSDQPMDPDQMRMAKIWGEVLGREVLGPSDNFFDLGGYSLLAVRLFAEIEREFGARIPLTALFQAPTVSALTHRVVSRTPAPPAEGGLVAVQPLGKRAPLFCIPSAGGTGLEYLPLARNLGTDQPVFAFQVAGLDDVRPPHCTIAEMADEYVTVLRSEYPGETYLLAGWSSGGVVAYEMARRLVEAGSRVGLLALFDSGFPTRRDPNRPRAYWKLLKGKAGGRTAVRRIMVETRHVLGNIRHGVPMVISDRRERPADIKHVGWRFWRITRRAIGAYTPAPYPGTITFFQAVDGAGSDRVANRWKQVAARVETIGVAGTHAGETGLIYPPQVTDLAVRLTEVLDRINVARNR